MNDRKLKYIFGLISTLLLFGLLYKIIKLPGGLILPGYFMGGMLLIAVLIGCLIITAILRLIFKRKSFLTLFAIVTAVAFVVSHYYLYSPTLKIVVPKGYTGEVNLVLSNVDKNILALDSNGIGYLNKWTFEKTYTPPMVVDDEGKQLNDQCVGFNPSTFWGSGYHTSTKHPEKIYTLSFEIVPKDKAGQKQHYNNIEFTELVDTTKLLTTK
ncbi:hypothetical protein [Hymenobacter coalescens]